ncbi:MAG: 4-hydroxy-3-methylbut-2-enyl diphosphate reductase [Candidatus Omnitrophica bacterium ADurb.Bin277]|nr:MAG: 4-hydroxy-3-methylbut-2-enyl diphosphate reductase [Candidatus Omnitrophica bacterium ADurb.Bin277]
MGFHEKPHRGGFGLESVVRPQLEKQYASSLIEKIRENNFCLKEGRLRVYLAEEFGFCYGVERAVEYAYETREKFRDRRIFLTDEIIHNPRVNRELRELGVQFLSGTSSCGLSVSDLNEKDIVMMPAFGVPVEALKQFQERGCVIVDTTCGSVMSVWKRVESYAKDDFTAVIHGKYDHEETRSTCSRAGKYLVVKNKEEARLACEYISGAGSRDLFFKTFSNACSPGFDPGRDLEKIGFANQTTMLMKESVEISSMIRSALASRYGEAEIEARFRHFDTICSATQDRQDAIRKLGEKKMDLLLVIGGYKSSNTGHLAEIASAYAPAFHIEDADCILSGDRISHRRIDTRTITETPNWLPEGDVKIGITAGASTPNRVVEEVIERLIRITG